MIGSNFNLYNTEWLNVVFANRNQTYGAYELRKNYSFRLTKALFIASALFVSLITAPLLYNYLKDDDVVEATTISTDDSVVRMIDVQLPPKKKELPAKAKGDANPVKTKTIAWTKPEVVPTEQVTQEVPNLKALQNVAIGTTSTEGNVSTGNAISTTPGTDGTAISTNGGTQGSDEVMNVALIEEQPMFPGGLEAFAKYLRKNLRYPDIAAESSIAGRVYLNFIVEKDGTLTDVKVVKGIGYGCDEEAVRVLKKSPKWSPGVQNHQKVRVQFTIPIVFQVQ